MAEMSPEDMSSLSEEKISAPSILLAKKLLALPLDPTLPQFFKDNTAKSKLALEELIQAVQSKASEEKIDELTQKMEALNKESIEGVAKYGLDLQEMMIAQLQKASLLIQETAKKIATKIPEVAKDPQAMVKMLFNAVADEVEGAK